MREAYLLLLWIQATVPRLPEMRPSLLCQVLQLSGLIGGCHDIGHRGLVVELVRLGHHACLLLGKHGVEVSGHHVKLMELVGHSTVG